MSNIRHHARSGRSSDGQVLVIVAAGMFVLIAMVGLIIDGGHALGQQRRAQNAADGVAMSGTAVIQEYLSTTTSTLTAGDVGCAVETAAAAHGIGLDKAEFTDFNGNVTSAVPACGSSGAIPAGSQGVKGTASEEFDTYLMRAVGFPTMTTTADATAVVGTPSGICPATSGCGVLPVTFSRTIDTCDGTNTRIVGEGEWRILAEDETRDSSNLAIVPLCKKAPGAVGWLDFGCGNLAAHITNPCNQYIAIPAWLDTSPGNPNCCESQLNAYAGSSPGVAEDADQVLYVPIHDNTCGTKPADSNPVCPGGNWTGQGNNVHYHIPYWVGFKLDGAFTQGNDKECNQLPGSPPAGG
ncbi:MAG: pilus assembly protein TadG-related protein, partial [Candidatus Limnocylindria bacterium]